ncbi:hypothetical protein NQZ68_007715 [Dissostichus eleginoides]|nr:hypothetical protein NQZ68_007715 [Dissostichus eleginoides]
MGTQRTALGSGTLQGTPIIEARTQASLFVLRDMSTRWTTPSVKPIDQSKREEVFMYVYMLDSVVHYGVSLFGMLLYRKDNAAGKSHISKQARRPKPHDGAQGGRLGLLERYTVIPAAQSHLRLPPLWFVSTVSDSSGKYGIRRECTAFSSNVAEEDGDSFSQRSFSVSSINNMTDTLAQ